MSVYANVVTTQFTKKFRRKEVEIMLNCDSCFKDVSELTPITTHYGAKYELCKECLEAFIANEKACEEIK